MVGQEHKKQPTQVAPEHEWLAYADLQGACTILYFKILALLNSIRVVFMTPLSSLTERTTWQIHDSPTQLGNS